MDNLTLSILVFELLPLAALFLGVLLAFGHS